MKKRFCALLALLLLFSVCLSPMALAEAAEEKEVFIIDEAGILTEEQALNLESLAGDLFENARVGVYVVTVYDYTANCAGGVTDAAIMTYWAYEMGHGEDQDGLILFLSMKERDYALVSYGEYANACFDDAGKDQLEEAFLDNFREDDWEGGLRDYLLVSAKILQEMENDEPVVEDGVTAVATAEPGAFSLLLPLLILLGLLFLA